MDDSKVLPANKPNREPTDYCDDCAQRLVPELLAALKAFVEPWSKGGNWQAKITYTTFDNARKAIAKAKGSS